MESGKSNDISLESWIWDAACSIRGAKDAPKYKDFILPLIFTKRLCDVFDDEINGMAQQVGSRTRAFKLVKHDKKLVRFFLPLAPKNPDDAVWSVIRALSDKIGEQLTSHLRAIADANPLLKGIIDRIDFNATTHGQRDIDDARLSNLIEAINAKRLGLDDVEPDIIGRSYEYLDRKFAEGSGQSAGEFYTPTEVGFVIARIMDPEPGMDVYDPCCGSAGLLIKCELTLDEKRRADFPNRQGRKENGGREYPLSSAPLKLYGQENEPGTWAMANMNMIIHDMEGEIQIGDTFRKPKFRQGNRLRTFDRAVANPMWNQTEFKEKDYDADELDRFPKGAGFPGGKADWGWVQHILASLKPHGRAAVVGFQGPQQCFNRQSSQIFKISAPWSPIGQPMHRISAPQIARLFESQRRGDLQVLSRVPPTWIGLGSKSATRPQRCCWLLSISYTGQCRLLAISSTDHNMQRIQEAQGFDGVFLSLSVLQYLKAEVNPVCYYFVGRAQDK